MELTNNSSISGSSKRIPGGSEKKRERLAVSLIFIMLSGCQPDVRVNTSATSLQSGKQHDLAIVGYNYTDRVIASFTVNGVGGGNIHLSGGKSGGGGIGCCARFFSAGGPNEYVVRWNTWSCRYNVTPRRSGEPTFSLHKGYKQEKVSITYSANEVPGYLELHFFPDGTLKARITAELSEPILNLSSDRKAEPNPQCPGNKRPPIEH